MDERHWYYAMQGEKQGPVSEMDLVRMFGVGELPVHTLVWTQGMQAWTNASDVANLLPPGLVTGASAASPLYGGFQPQYAGFWKRCAAMLVDNVILYAAGLVLGLVAGGAIGAVMGGAGAEMEAIVMASISANLVLGLVLNWLYFTVLESSSNQATVGKMALGILVTDMDGQRISFARANGRYWAKIISTLIFFIGFFMAAFTEKKQALHDIMAGCLLVNK